MSAFFKTNLLVLLLCLGLVASEIDDFKMMTENYPPYNMKVDGQLQGISIDLWAKMLPMIGSKKGIKDIELLPWARAYDIVQKEKNTALFAMFRTPAREKMFKWVGPIDSSVIGLIARKDKNIVINSLQEVKKYKIGTVKDDVAELLLIEKGVDKKELDSLSGTNSILKSIRKLNYGRIDLFAYINNIKEWSIEGVNPNDYEVVYVLQRQELHFALHKQSSDLLIKKLQMALDELKTSGIYDEILKKYK